MNFESFKKNSELICNLSKEDLKNSNFEFSYIVFNSDFVFFYYFFDLIYKKRKNENAELLKIIYYGYL